MMLFRLQAIKMMLKLTPVKAILLSGQGVVAVHLAGPSSPKNSVPSSFV